MSEKIVILDFGSQYTQLIARRVRELNVYCEIYPYHHFPVPDESVKGIILSGSPYSVHDPESPNLDLTLFNDLPVLGICFGAQYIAHHTKGGNVLPSKIREYGRAELELIQAGDELIKGVEDRSQVWMSHGDTIDCVPQDFEVIASTNEVKIAAYHIKDKPVFGIQFHPEVYHTKEGKKILSNFIYDICNCSGDWSPEAFVESTIRNLKEQIKNDQVLIAISGGVDSSVAALLLHRAIGKNLHCIFVDNGLLRKDEYQKVLDSYIHLGLNIKGVDAKKEFYDALKGVSDPETKRKIIGSKFIDIFDKEATEIQNIKWLAQGTIYPDVIESVSVNGPSATIKSHHNVGGLPEKMNLKIIEPLRSLFKDEVRNVGGTLALDPLILNRHPFPGPGLAIRILGDVTEEKVRLLQEVDHIFIEGLKNANLYDDVWQAGAILLPIQSVGVMGDERTYEKAVALRAVASTDGMTADWCHLPYEFLADMSSQIINKVKGVNRVVYDISSKPPATIEWE